MLAFGSCAAALSLADAMRADDTASRLIRFGRFAGDRSPSCTRRAPKPFPSADTLPPPSDARACGDSCGMRLDRLRGRSTRMGPMFDRRRPLLLEPFPGVSGPRFAGLLWLWCRSRALPWPAEDEVLDSSEGE